MQGKSPPRNRSARSKHVRRLALSGVLLSILLTSVSAFGAIAPGIVSAASGAFIGPGTLSEAAGVPIAISGTLLDASNNPTSGSVTLTASAGTFVGASQTTTVIASTYGDFSAMVL